MGTSARMRCVSARTKVIGSLSLVVVVCLLAPASASAVASYVFEPTLSLTGNCAESKLDPVPDPGLCPIPPGTTFSGSPGADHPSTRFEAPSVTIDSYGDIYVASMMTKKGRIDVFAPDGAFITEFKDEAGPQSIAVDGKGNVYVFERNGGEEPKQIRRFPPKAYKPDEGLIEYGEEPVVLANDKTKPVIPLSFESSLAVEPISQRVYVNTSHAIAVFGSAEEENKLLEPEAISGFVESSSIAIDAAHKKIYVADKVPITKKSVIRIFEFEDPHKEVGKITGSTTPKGEFLSGEGFLEIDVDEETGHVFVGDIVAANKVYEFEESGSYLATIEHSFEAAIGPGGIPGEIAVDNGPNSPRPQKEAWLFVPSVPSSSTGHVYAFEPREEGPPIIESISVSNATETEAILHATINPDGLATEYRLEYLSRQQFEEEGGESFANENASLAGAGTLPKGGEGVGVLATAEELEPNTRYVYRAFADNAEGEVEELGGFKTFVSQGEEPPVCANEALRKSLSALLPDCRAYELVTPPDTNGRPPTGGFVGVYFPTLRAAPNGNHASFVLEGGILPGQEGTGAFNGDTYLASRTSEGWMSVISGPNGEEVKRPPLPGSVSPDQSYSFWEDTETHIRYPNGHSELVGRGSLGEDPNVDAELITQGAGHIIFNTKAPTAVRLEEDSPPAGTAAVYDRPAEGSTDVVSLLPGDIVPVAGESASYLGASGDGEGIAFSIGGTIYLRLHNEETFEVAGPGTEFAGVADEGNRVFYTEGGDLLAFDAVREETIPFSTTGDITPVNVASDGTRAYLVSPSVLTGEPNPEDEVAKTGAENLYLAEGEGQFSFIAKVTKRDVEGEFQRDGMGLWTTALKSKSPAIDSSRTTPSGTTLLFESRADLTDFESEGFAQVYRYDQSEESLNCLSCNQTETPPTSDASLQSIAKEQFSREPAGSHMEIQNQSPDGARAFFQTAEPLVLADSDGKLDVYEWEEAGLGSCQTPGGCVSLISGPHSAGPDYLYAMSQSGGDVFFRTADQILPRDAEATLSIYDARVGGGFLEPSCGSSCCGDICRPVNPSPELPKPTTSAIGPNGNVTKPKHCPKGKHIAKRHGKKICVRNHKKHRRAGMKKKGGR